ncbi:MAG: hypothetical protein LBF67_08385 [Prevotellaceae bacterium]|jgi:hypothetical protein|nr:hypothetical protein [Prevotellaceae bacterium]
MKNVLFFILCAAFALPCRLYAQRHDLEYSVMLFDSPTTLYTMRQSNENYLSAYRYATRKINQAVSPFYALLIQADLHMLFLSHVTHNAARQSILVGEGVSSTSVPHLINKKMWPYISGVSDADLQRLRDTRLPTYIRLHLAAPESDYALSLRTNSLLSWNKEEINVVRGEYMMRRLTTFFYYFEELFGSEGTNAEEADELDRDITGNEVRGAIRHLHRPEMGFHRYTAYSDLTEEEKRFAKRVGKRSIINLIDPVFWFQNGFRMKSGNKANFMLAYNMAPFGDFIDQHFWLMTRTLNLHFYLREYENRSTWFPAAGVTFANVQPFSWMMFDATLHGWQQPQNLDFNTAKRRYGGAVDVTLKFFDKTFIKDRNICLSLNLGVVAKTQGYLPEEMALGNHVGGRVGVSIWFK